MRVLKAEIRSLEATFPRGHSRLQIVSASVDELTCKFVDQMGRKHTIHANITVSKNNDLISSFVDLDGFVLGPWAVISRPRLRLE